MHSSLDLTQFEASAKWNSIQEVIQLANNLGVLYFIYQAPIPQTAPILAQFRKILLKGAPQHVRVTLAGILQGCQTVANAIEVLKLYEDRLREGSIPTY